MHNYPGWLRVPVVLLLWPQVSAYVDTSKWVGTAYTPSAAVNNLWWHAFEEYEPSVIREVGMAHQLGMTALRVFLHSMVFEADSARLLKSMDRFLAIAAKRSIGVGFVFFDDCWAHSGGSLSAPCKPVKGRHNGCWMAIPQDPDRTAIERYRPYVSEVVSAFRTDPRVLWWEIFNEPNQTDEWSLSLRQAGYYWAKGFLPTQPVISCWDDNTATDIVDVHSYDSNFLNTMRLIYTDPSKGALVTEAGSRWYQPPYFADQGSPLVWLKFLKDLKANTSNPFIPGVMICWTLMVGNDNTRWHWSTPDRSAEPTIPWDGWFFPDGTPVSFTEVAALRRYITGEDPFLVYHDFLPDGVSDGDTYLPLDVGGYWQDHGARGGKVGDALVEVSFWPERANSTFTLAIRTKSSSSVLNHVDIGSMPDYANLVLGQYGDATAACRAACLNDASCQSWTHRYMGPNETDKNCRGGDRCCWLRKGAIGVAIRPYCVSGYVSRDEDGYHIVVDGTKLIIRRKEHGQVVELSAIDVVIFENSVVPRAWNMLRVHALGGRLLVWLNPMYPETGFLGNADDRFRVPRQLLPRLSVVDPRPLAAGGIAVAAHTAPARVDYISALPLEASSSTAEL